MKLPLQYHELLRALRQRRARISFKAIQNELKHRLSRRYPAELPLDYAFQRVGVFLTRRCNLSCPFCHFKSVVNKSTDDYEMTFERFQEFYRHPYFNSALLYIMVGGEPLLNEATFEILDFLHHERRLTCMFTNGTLLCQNENLDRLLESGLNSLIISVYESNIKKLRDTLPEINKKYRCILTKLVSPEELKDYSSNILSETASLAATTNCLGVRYSLMVDPDSLGFDSPLIITDDNAAYFEFVNYVKRSFPKLNAEFLNPLPASLEKRKTLFCSFPWRTVQVDARGGLTFCCGTGGSDQIATTIHCDQPLNTKFFVDMRSSLLNPTVLHQHCGKCFYLANKNI